jgi:membrane-associated protein
MSWALGATVPPTQLAVLHIHHHLHGPSLGYVGIGLAAAGSWAGIPGPGEAALVAGGILAARGRLDLAELLVVAWIGAVAGGMAGWGLGRRLGAALLSAPGPLYRQRVIALARGERFFARYGVLAVYFAPSWVAGATGLGAARFIPANAVSGLLWALLVGIGAYVVGPPIAEVVSDLSLVGLAALGALAVAAVEGIVARHRRRSSAGR